ncbi:MAG: hypothetical protein IT305_18230 [Chloroflexi bacterium]|nr:hypothetical protein [Chloroflexota bacterium]
MQATRAIRQTCDTAVFDGSYDDPRVLVWVYQQRVRRNLLNVQTDAARQPSALGRMLTSVSRPFGRVADIIAAPLAQPGMVTVGSR